MAKKNSRQDPEPSPSDPNRDESLGGGQVDDGHAVDETIRIDNEDSTPDVTQHDDPWETELIETVDGLSAASLVEGETTDDHSTIIPDPHATLIPEDEENKDEADPDATVGNLDSTMGIDSQEDEPGDVQPSDQPPHAVDPNKITVGEVDQTIAINLPKTAKSSPTVRSGKVSKRGAKPGKQSDTTVNVRDKGGSILSSPNIGETVNPRELSEQDVTLWNSAVGDAPEEPSVLPPAIDRTFSDTQFDRLRKCDVAELRSDVDKASDYRLVRKLGQGGMGDVFVARQGSLDRLLALKLIKPLTGKKRAQLIKTGKLEFVEEERRQQFLSEAIVTGDLDHPNIVPIHDVALTSSNELFYSMKRVVGTPWSEVIKEKTRDENLEILLKAADAVGFAHTRGVVHRDIKPENIMLGDFGVVMVMDWGLALPTSDYEKQNSIFSTSGLGGTPAFMAPEMATGPLEKIGPAADIYLLGATLYMIITGRAPHQAKNVTECLIAVRNNMIREVPEQQHGELLDVALKAMATNPEDRYLNVESFQTAIRDYRSHAESISLAARASEDLESGKQNRSYADLSRAAFRFEEALKSWNGNEKAHEGLAETKLVHANAAYENGDFDLGLSLLDEQDSQHQPVLKKLREGIRERDSRESRLSMMRKVAVAMLAVIIVGGSGAYLKLQSKNSELASAVTRETRAKEDAQQKKEEAENAREEERIAKEDAKQKEKEAENAREEERIAKEDAKQKEKDAVDAREEERIAKVDAQLKERRAKEAEREAQLQREKAVNEKQRAEYEVYVSGIGLAKARLERNEADDARRILEELRVKSPESARTWEWRWLWKQANQSESEEQSDAAIKDLFIAPSGRRGVVALSDGKVDLLALSETGQLTDRYALPKDLLGTIRATSVAMAPDERSIVIGADGGEIFIVRADAGPKLLNGHRGEITDLQFSDEGFLVSASADRTVRVWDPKSGRELTKENACWHISPVRQVAVAGSGPSLTLAAAISDDATGRVAIWTLSRSGDTMSVKRRGTFTGHRHPVSSVAISSDGRSVASGDVAGNVLLWNPKTVRKIDYGGAIENAFAKIDGKVPKPKQETPHSPLVDSSAEEERRLVSTARVRDDAPRAHGDVVKAIRFSKDGKSLLTSSDDYTLKVWDVRTKSVNKTLKGHGGWVVGAEFIRGLGDVVISASNDATVRTWRPSKYVGAFVIHKMTDEKSTGATRETQAHDDEVLSASFSLDGKKVVTASHDHTARVMQLDEQTLAFKEVARLDDEVLDEGTSYVAMSLQLDRPHKRLYIGSADATIRVWDLERGTQVGEATGTGLNTSFAVSRDGLFMLTGSSSPAVKANLWRLDPTTNSAPRRIKRFKGHDEAVTAFAISPDSKLLFTGDRGGYGILWDAATGKQVGSPIEYVRGFRINASSFSADGRELLIASDDEQLTIVNLQSRQRVARLNHDGFVTQLSLSSDGNHALTVSELSSETQFRSTATHWDLRSGLGQVLDRLTEQRDQEGKSSRKIQRRITSARFDGSDRIAVVSRAAHGETPASVGVWNVDRISNGSAVRVLTRAPSVSQSSPRRQQPERTYQLPPVLGTADVVLPIDDQLLLTMNKNAAFKWDMETEQLIKSYRAHAELTEACFSHDAKYVATGSRSVKIWDATTGEALAKLELDYPVRSVQFAPKMLGPTNYVFATGGDEGVVRLWTWDPENRSITEQDKEQAVAAAKKNLPTIRRIRFSPDANQLFVVGDEGLAELRRIGKPDNPIVFDVADKADLLCAAFSPDGRYVAAGGKDYRVRIWKVANPGDQAIRLVGHAGDINDVAFLGSPSDGTEENRPAGNPFIEDPLGEEKRDAGLRVMTASSDDSARVWDPRFGVANEDGNFPGGREIISLRRHTGDVTSVDVTDNGQLLMTAGRDGAVILWPADPPQPIPPRPPQPNLFDQLDADPKTK